MPATPDRTTVTAAVQAFMELLRENLVADPPTVDAPFRRVEVAQATFEAFARPFLTLLPTRTRMVAGIDDDKLIEVACSMGIVADATGDDAHDSLLAKIGVVEDYLDTLIESGWLEGADGFDSRTWTLDQPRSTAGSRVVSATALATFVVKVEREHNRIPAS